MPGPDEVLEAEGAQFAFEERHTELGQQHPRAFVDVTAEPLPIEVIAMEMRDVQVVGRGERVGIEPVVARKRKPRPEVRGSEPRVAEHRAGPGLDEESDVAEEGQSHQGHSCQFARSETDWSARIGLAKWTGAGAAHVCSVPLQIVEVRPPLGPRPGSRRFAGGTPFSFGLSLRSARLLAPQ